MAGTSSENDLDRRRVNILADDSRCSKSTGARLRFNWNAALRGLGVLESLSLVVSAKWHYAWISLDIEIFLPGGLRFTLRTEYNVNLK